MPAPIANFGFITQGLSVTFTDSSLNVPTSWSWDFGDPNSGLLNVSTVQNPVHLFSLSGTYLITFTATNGLGSSIKTYTLEISESGSLLGIREMIAGRIPAGITIDPAIRDNYIKIEQLFLQPLLSPPISDVDLFVESEWPLLANVLVAELVSYKLILDQVNSLILALSNSSSGSTSTAQAALKKIVTGPSEAEWYNNVEATTNFLSNTFKNGSLFEKTTLGVICALVERLGIQHPYCPNSLSTVPGLATISVPTILPTVGYYNRNRADGY